MSGNRSGLLWASGLVVAMVGLYLYGLVSYEPDAFHVTWTTDGQNEVEEWELGPGAEARFSFRVPARNLTTVAASVAWEDEVGGPDRLSVNVTGPFGPDGAQRTIHLENTTSPIAIEVPFLAIPSVSTLHGIDERDVFEQLGAGAAPWQGERPVNITVWLMHANGTAAPVGDLEVQPDPGQSIRVSMSFTQYRAQVIPR